MDILTFIAEISKAVAWPTVALGALFVLRRELKGLVPLVTSLKYKDFEITFGREAAQARAEAARLPAPAGRQLAAGPELSGTVARLLEVSPRAAIIEAWREVEQAALDAAIRKDIAIPRLPSVPPTRLIHALSAYHALSSEQVALLHDLRGLRNQAAHAPEFALSSDSARDFAIAAAQVVQQLNAA